MIYNTLPKTISEWDKFLLGKYHYGIVDFSFPFAFLLMLYGHKYNSPSHIRVLEPGCNKYLRSDMKMMDSLKKYIVKKLKYHVKIFSPLDESIFEERFSSDWIIDYYELTAFFEKLDEEIRYDKLLSLNTPSWIKRGAPIKFVYLINSLWAQVMRDQKGRNWKTILSLLKFFYENLKKASYSKLLEGIDVMGEDELKREYHIIIKNRAIAEEIRDLTNQYFPRPGQKRYDFEMFQKPIGIEFKKDYINIRQNPGGPVIKFPNGIQFP
jgi:hypothetical protein